MDVDGHDVIVRGQRTVIVHDRGAQIRRPKPDHQTTRPLFRILSRGYQSTRRQTEQRLIGIDQIGHRAIDAVHVAFSLNGGDEISVLCGTEFDSDHRVNPWKRCGLWIGKCALSLE